MAKLMASYPIFSSAFSIGNKDGIIDVDFEWVAGILKVNVKSG